MSPSKRALSGAFLALLSLHGERLPSRTFTAADGLVRNAITRIRRDPRGYLWLCTPEGLSLFDGSTFRNYTTSDGLPDRAVNDITPLADGSYALATGKGLFHFRPRHDNTGRNVDPSFEPIPRLDGKTAPAIVVTLRDRLGAVWAGGRNDLFRQAPGASGLETIALEPPTHIVYALEQDAEGQIWIGTTDGLYRYRESSHSGVLVYPTRDVAAILPDHPGRLWVGEWGLTLLDVRAPIPTVVAHFGPEASPILNERVFSLSRAREGVMWIGGTGVIRFDPAATGAARFRAPEMPAGWSTFVSSLQADEEGNVWAAVHTHGLLSFWERGFTMYGQADGISGRDFAGMFAGCEYPIVFTYLHHGYAWSEFDGHRFLSVEPRLPPSVPSAGWGGGGVALRASTGDWWAVSEAGLLHYPAADFPRLAGRAPIAMVTAREGLPSNAVLQVFEDSGGNVWAGTLNGFARRDRATGRWTGQTVERLTGHTESVDVIAEDRSGNIWLGISSLGLIRYRNGVYEWISRDIPTRVNHLFVDSRGRLWIASSRDGLGRIDHPEAPMIEVHRYGLREGLSSAELFAVGEDLSGRIYIAGGHGIDRLEVATGRIEPLPGEAGTSGQLQYIFRDRMGAMWFAGSNVITRYEPRPDAPLRLPRPVFHSIRVAGERRFVSDLGDPEVSSLRLKPGETGMDVEMGVVRLGPGEDIRFQYRIAKGNSSAAWSSPIASNLISLAGLSAGRYTLAVRALHRSEPAGADSAFLAFEVAPFIWERWSFQLPLGAALVGLAAAFHRVRLGRLIELERVRSRIAADLHDDLGASLSQVAILSEVASRRSHDADAVRRHTERISALCRDALGATSDMVWAVDPRHDRLSDLDHRMREFATEVLSAREIALQFDVFPRESNLFLGANLRRQLYFIFKEGINNAVRHSGASHVTVRLRVEKRWITLAIEDDGRGAAAASAAAGAGNGLRNIRRRVADLGGSIEAGAASSGGFSLRLRLPLP
jgi:signal transduction histidine kinase/ligand-binding sensor domain-containing protein